MYQNPSETIYIRDAFFYLVASGSCHVYLTDDGQWRVALNGRLFLQVEGKHPTLYIFECRTENGTVKVTFPRKEF